MTGFRPVTVAVIACFGLSGSAKAEFLTFNDEASYLAALEAGGVDTGQAASADSSAGVTAMADGPTVHSGPIQIFNSGFRSFVGFSGIFNLISGAITASLDGSDGGSITSSGFKGWISWGGFKHFKLESDEATTWNVTDVETAYDSVVPEPASFALFGMGAAGLIGFGARRRRRVSESAA